ncbi:MAG: ASKHA domain-containing protein [Candidatus Omnitrophota bacterium]
MEKFKVIFKPSEKTAEVGKGADLLATAVSCGAFINSSCGGEGVCGRCKVIIKKGKFRTEPTGRISHEERKKGYVLACLTTVEGDLEVVIPKESRLDLSKIRDEEARFHRLKGLFSETAEIDQGKPIISDDVFTHSPISTKIYLELPPPTLEDTVSDYERLIRELHKKYNIEIIQVGLRNIKRLGSVLRHSDWKITATLGKRNETTEVVIIEPGDASKANYGVAFDIGTTTVSGQLIDLNTKKILGTKATYNKQIAFGDDVITRIIYATEESGLERLHHAVIDNMNSIMQELVNDNHIPLNNVTGVICAGNTTMIHLLLRVDPTYIRREPYVSTANFVPVIRAAEAGIKIHPRGLLACIPGVSTYVGGDIVAGVVACGINNEDKLTLLIDIGTNGEIVVGNKEWMACCSASAGPAFEGSGVTCGMRAVKGAIERVKIDANLEENIKVIGKGKPMGICGSGYIDLISEMFKRGIIKRDGRINSDLKGKRIRKSEGEYEYVVVPKNKACCDYDIVIKESDIENMKRSKGAIYSAASILVKKFDLTFNDLDQIYIAGGFGTYLNIDNAISTGLLPDLDRKKFQFVGNSSLIGARSILLSYDTMKEAEGIARKMTYIELSKDPTYMDEYMSSLFFPHTRLEDFPSVNISRNTQYSIRNTRK